MLTVRVGVGITPCTSGPFRESHASRTRRERDILTIRLKIALSETGLQLGSGFVLRSGLGLGLGSGLGLGLGLGSNL